MSLTKNRSADLNVPDSRFLLEHLRTGRRRHRRRRRKTFRRQRRFPRRSRNQSRRPRPRCKADKILN